MPDYCIQAARYIVDVAQNQEIRIVNVEVPSKEFFGLVAFVTTPFVILGVQAAPTIRELCKEHKMGRLETKNL